MNALLIKDSAYAYVLSLAEVMKRSNDLRYMAGDVIGPYVLAALLYVALTFPLAFTLDRWGNRRKKKIGL